MQVKKQQLELYMEQTGSKLGKEYVKVVYCHSAYLTYMQSRSCETPGRMKHKLESRLLGEISIISDTLMAESEEELKSLLMKVKVKSLSHMRLLATPWTAAYQAPPSMGFSRQDYYFCFIDDAKAFDCVDHNKLWKILQEMRITDHLSCLLRNLYAGQEATVRTVHGTDWFQIGKGVR